MRRLNYIANFIKANRAVLLIFLFSCTAFGATYFKDVLVDRLTADNIRLDVNTISSINANGNLLFSPNGSGKATFKDANLIFQDSSDLTKQLSLELGSITTGTTRTWTFPDISDTFVGLAGTQTLTNKTLTSPTLTTPNTEVITFDDQATPANPSAGFYKLYFKTDGNLYRLNSAGSESAFAAASGGVPASQVRSVITTDSPSAADDVLKLSGASFTVTLPTAVGITGKILTLVHGGTSLTQVYTLATTGGQTIGGIASGLYALRTNAEALSIVSDNANWVILEHKAITDWSATATNTIQATTTNPTKGAAPTIDTIRWRRIGATAEIIMAYKNSAAGTNGNGDYLFSFPTNLTVNTADISTYTAVVGGSEAQPTNILGTASASVNSPDFGLGTVSVYDSSLFRIVIGGGGQGVVSSGVFGLGNAGTTYNASFSVPIAGWQP